MGNPSKGKKADEPKKKDATPIAEKIDTIVETPETKRDLPVEQSPASVATNLFTSIDIGKNTTSPEQPSPPKKSKKSDHTYFCFEMKNGLESVYMDDPLQAMSFRQEFKHIISRERTFPNRDKWIAHQNRKPAAANKTTKSTQNSNPSDDTDKAAADKILQLLSKNEEGERIVGYYKTTSSSKMAVIIFRAVDNYGKDPWHFKPQLLVDVITAYSQVSPSSDLVVREALGNMKFGPRSDPEKTNKDSQLVETYISNYDKKERSNPVYAAYTFITIPFEEFTNPMEEDEYLSAMTEKIIFELLRIMKTPVFAEVMTRRHETKQANFIKAMYDSSKKTNFPKFLASAQVRKLTCGHLTEHVTQSVANEIMVLFFNERHSGPKYCASAENITE